MAAPAAVDESKTELTNNAKSSLSPPKEVSPRAGSYTGKMCLWRHKSARLAELPSEEEANSLNLGMIGNGTFSALLNPHGRIVWSCLPRMDSDPVFCHLLTGPKPGDRERGFFDILIENFDKAESHYVKNTAIIRTVLSDKEDQSIEIIDYAPRFKHYERRFCPTNIVRLVRPLKGNPRVTVRCRPCYNYGEAECQQVVGVNHIAYKGAEFDSRLTTTVPVSFIKREIPFELTRDQVLFFGVDEPLRSDPRVLCHEWKEKTQRYWRDWVRALSIPLEWQDEVIRSAIVLKMCQSQESGAIVAAVTTSIPESAHSGRNWDYRFCWLRDSYHTVSALNRLGAVNSMTAYLEFVSNVVAGAKAQGRVDMQPVYGVAFETQLTESHCKYLAGYRGMGPVRVGNLAYIQDQNDNYGSVILALLQMFFDSRIELDDPEYLFHRLEALGEIAFAKHNLPDAGLWELRGSKNIHTFSTAMCWAACDRLALISAKLDKPDRESYWREKADKIKVYCLDGAWDESLQAYAATINHPNDGNGRDLDASVLLLCRLGLTNGQDPRYVKTVDAVAHRLLHNGYLYRYKVKDDFGFPEVSFVVCTFWYIEALASIGRTDEARELFENILDHRNDYGLMSEDLDTDTNEMWGNFPQTYSLVGIINSALMLSQPWSSVGL